VNIEAILFDADGVIQRPPLRRRQAWQDLIGPDQNVDEFVVAAFEIERAALEGHSDFVGAFSDLLAEWNCLGSLEDGLAAWTMIEADSGMAQTIETLRQQGLRCYLATNQEPFRASYMSAHLGYGSLFDREFYSCRMGIAKPATAYFRLIVDELGVPPPNVLFLDDHEVNVSAAREVGLNAARFMLESGSREVLLRTLASFGIQVV
jgi:putative hydrolase of the HAD superfamily